MLLQNKIAIVTGANRGIGKCITETFVRNGASVFACIRQNQPETEQWVGTLSPIEGAFVKTICAELTDDASVKNIAREVMSVTAKVDILVNNAGIASGSLFQMTSLSEIRRVFEVNFFSPILLTQGISRLMTRQKSGSIINISSTAALIPDPGTLAYGSSKAALVRATQSIATELGSSNIRVNAIAPGVTRTDMYDQMAEPARDALIESSALRRIVEPQDIANTALFLASDLSLMITGQVLRVDGGTV